MREQTLGAGQGLGGWQAGTLGSVSIATSSRRTGFPWGRGCCWLEHEASRFPPLPLFTGANITPDPQGLSPPGGARWVPPHCSSCRGTGIQIRGLVQSLQLSMLRPELSVVVWGVEPRLAAQTAGSGGPCWASNPCTGLWSRGSAS